MRKTALLTLVLAAGGLFAAEIPHEHPYREAYKKKTFSPFALLRVTGNATWGQITNKPDEWGRGIGGFGARVGSGFATHVVRNSITYPVAAALHEDLTYHRSTSTHFGPRLGHALLCTVWTRKTTTGQGTVAYGQISGTFGSALISRAWQPASIRTWSSGFTSAGVSFGGQAAVNVVREFWPKKKNNNTSSPTAKP
jgi:hypothetical protein